MGKNTSVFALFANRVRLEEAIDRLRVAGFRAADVSVLFADNVGNKDFGHEKGSKAPEGATVGGSTGAIAGGALGWLAGIGALAIPGIGPFIAAGPIMAALAGAGAGAALGGLTGGLVGSGMPEYEAKRYEGRVREGSHLLSVHCDDGDWADKAEQLLREAGGEDISNSSESSADYAATDKPIARGTSGRM